MRRLAEARMSSSTRVAGFAALAVVMMAGLVWSGQADQVWAAQGKTIKLKVTYAGSGEVSATNAIYVAAWDTPNIQGGAFPIGGQVVVENGGVASFENLSAATIYLTALYVPGGWDQASAPPSGTSVWVYNPDAGFAPGAVEVGDGETVELELSFDDTILLP